MYLAFVLFSYKPLILKVRVIMCEIVRIFYSYCNVDLLRYVIVCMIFNLPYLKVLTKYYFTIYTIYFFYYNSKNMSKHNFFLPNSLLFA